MGEPLSQEFIDCLACRQEFIDCLACLQNPCQSTVTYPAYRSPVSNNGSYIVQQQLEPGLEIVLTPPALGNSNPLRLGCMPGHQQEVRYLHDSWTSNFRTCNKKRIICTIFFFLIYPSVFFCVHHN